MNIGNSLAALCRAWRGHFFHETRCPACHAPFVPLVSTAGDAPPQLCPACAAHIPQPPEQRCCRCAASGLLLPDPEGKLSLLCPTCHTAPPPWQRLTYVAPYEGLFQQLILRFKFGQDFSLLPLLVHWLTKACQTLPPCQVLVPMPRHPARLRERGFNQVHELCRLLAAGLGIPLRADMLCRTRKTKPQMQLSGQERKRNPENSFAASNVLGLHILLIDDVITTGSTLRHAAQTLHQAGAASIQTAVLAKVSSEMPNKGHDNPWFLE